MVAPTVVGSVISCRVEHPEKVVPIFVKEDAVVGRIQVAKETQEANVEAKVVIPVYPDRFILFRFEQPLNALFITIFPPVGPTGGSLMYSKEEQPLNTVSKVTVPAAVGQFGISKESKLLQF